MDSVLVEYASFAASRTLLQQLQACLNFTLESKDLLCWYIWKKWFLSSILAAQAAENHRDKCGLTWYLWWGIYTSIPTWTHSQISLAAAEALSSHMTMKNIPISTTIVRSHTMEWHILFGVYGKVNGKWDNNMIKISQWRESQQILASEERKKFKRAGLS